MVFSQTTYHNCFTHIWNHLNSSSLPNILSNSDNKESLCFEAYIHDQEKMPIDTQNTIPSPEIVMAHITNDNTITTDNLKTFIQLSSFHMVLLHISIRQQHYRTISHSAYQSAYHSGSSLLPSVS